MGFFKEFRDFAVKGNVVDMAVGIIIGAAFGEIVNSLVKDVLMPPLGMLMAGVDFSQIHLLIQEAKMEGDKVVTPAVDVRYGAFINSMIRFVIVAFAIFIMIKAINAAKRAEPPPAPAGPTKDQQLLTEIRDALVKRAG